MIARTTLPLTSLIVNNNNNDNNRRRISSSNSSKRGRRRNNYPLKLFAKQRNNINIKTTTTTDRAELFEVSRTDPNMRTLEECAIKMDAETVDDVRDRLISRVLEALALG